MHIQRSVRTQTCTYTCSHRKQVWQSQTNPRYVVPIIEVGHTTPLTVFLPLETAQIAPKKNTWYCENIPTAFSELHTSLGHLPHSFMQTHTQTQDFLTCSTAAVLLILTMHHQAKDHQQDEDDATQSHHNEEPPLFVERCLHLPCGKEQRGVTLGLEDTAWHKEMNNHMVRGDSSHQHRGWTLTRWKGLGPVMAASLQNGVLLNIHGQVKTSQNAQKP